MTTVDVWAPHARTVRVQITDPDTGTVWTHPLTPTGSGWFTADTPDAQPGHDYGFLLDESPQLLPDPRSRWQPAGVHGPSRFYRDDFNWTDQAWSGRDLPGAVIYELHVGTFTTEGTFDAAINRLPYLAELGITHVELLPVNDFNGEWNWGYDGVLWYAVHEPYGGPDGLKRFVDAAHWHGLAVTLDVVYNHLGPSGNYLPLYGPYFKPGRNTWGDLINLDGEGSADVRRYILDNALGWLSTFHIDALRLDAVHALQDESPIHLLAELATRVQALSAELGKPLVLIAESDLNDSAMVTPVDRGGRGMDAQWDDDVHHALHALLTGERHGYYDDFGTLAVLAKVWTHAFFHDGTYSTFRKRRHGKPVDVHATAGYRFVACLQNHDQVGNRAAGDRLPETLTDDLLKVGAVLLFTAPFTPMLWMGEEWAASTRWPFFTSHPEPELGEAVSKGRIAEFADHGWNTDDMIDPQDPRAYTAAKLNWDEMTTGRHAELLATYRTLIRLRRDTPDLADPDLSIVEVDYDEGDQWLLIHRRNHDVAVNFGSERQHIPTAAASKLVYATAAGAAADGDGLVLPPHSAVIVRRRTP